MKKTIRNIMIVCLLVLATIVVAPNVFAAISPDNQKGSITVSNLETGKSVNIKLYRLMNVNVENGQPKSPVYTWTTSIANWIKNNSELDNTKYFVDPEGSNEVKEFSSADAKKLYEELAKAIRADSSLVAPEASASTSCTGAGENTTCESSHTFDNLTQGAYYILVDGGMKVYSPTSANVVPKYANNDWNIVTDSESGTNVNVDMKASEPSVEKKVNNKDNTSAKIGDELTFTLNITVPTYPSNAVNKKFVITDKLSDGLTYNNNAVIKNQEGNPVSQTVSFNAETNTITIDFSGDDYSKIEGQTTITVTYTATLNEKAEITTPNTNDAKIVYNTDPYNSSSNDTEDEDITKVFTYGLNIIKKGTDDLEGLEGAKFEISDGTNTLCFKATSTAGTYTYAGIKGANGCADGTDSEVETPANGNLVLKGLDQGTYSATETSAPDGYVKLQAPVTFTVTDTELTGILTSDTADEIADDGIITKTVMNNKGITLPVTGGIGTLIFSIVGVLFMGISVVLVRNILKKKEVQL